MLEDPPEDYKTPKSKEEYLELMKLYNDSKKQRLESFKKCTADGFVESLVLYSEALEKIFFVAEVPFPEIQKIMPTYDLMEHLNNLKKVIISLQRCSECCYRIRKIEEGISICDHILMIQEKFSIPIKHIAKTYGTLSRLYIENGRLDISRKYLELARKANPKMGFEQNGELLSMAERGEYGGGLSVRESEFAQRIFFRITNNRRVNGYLKNIFKMLKMRDAEMRVSEIIDRNDFLLDSDETNFKISIDLHYKNVKRRKHALPKHGGRMKGMNLSVHPPVERVLHVWKGFFIDSIHPELKDLESFDILETEENRLELSLMSKEEEEERRRGGGGRKEGVHLFDKIDNQVLLSLTIGDEKWVPLDCLFDYYVLFKRLKMPVRCYLICKQVSRIRYLSNLVYYFLKSYDKFEILKDFIDEDDPYVLPEYQYEDDDDDDDGDMGEKELEGEICIDFEREEYLKNDRENHHNIKKVYEKRNAMMKKRKYFFSGFAQACFNVLKTYEQDILSDEYLFKLFESRNLLSILREYETIDLEKHNEFSWSKNDLENMPWDFYDLAKKNLLKMNRDSSFCNTLLISNDQKEFEAHREVLILNSNFFFRMIRFGGMETQELKKSNSLELAFMDGEMVDLYLQYLYTGHFLRCDEDQFITFFKLFNHGKMYQEPRLQRKALHQLQSLSRKLEKKNKLIQKIRECGYWLKEDDDMHKELKEALFGFWKKCCTKTPIQKIEKAIAQSKKN